MQVLSTLHLQDFGRFENCESSEGPRVRFVVCNVQNGLQVGENLKVEIHSGGG